jgi:uncharacterized protein
MKRLFIIHGWGGSFDEPFYKQLTKKLEKKRWKAHSLEMPNSQEPYIKDWISTLSRAVGIPNKDTYFYGHSMGSQTILRYLQDLPESSKIGGAIFTAGYINLKPFAGEWNYPEPSWEKILQHTRKFINIMSDDDPYVPISDKIIFEKKLQAEVIIEHHKGHCPGSDSNIVYEKIMELSA